MIGRLSAAMLGAIAITGLSAGVGLGQSHGAHVHGIGGLDIVIEGTRVEMELELSGRDVVGFEHAPSTQEQKNAVQEAALKLKDLARLFRFPEDAGCAAAADVSVESELLNDGDGPGHHGDHAAFHARYILDCASPKALDGVDLLIFETFPAAQAIKVRAISPRGQRAREVHREAARMVF